MNKWNALIVTLILLCTEVQGQNLSPSYSIAPSLNVYTPIASDKQYFPTLGYNKNESPKLLVGGFGVSFINVPPFKKLYSLKFRAGLIKHAYWDETIELRNDSGIPIGTYVPKGSDYVFNLNALFQYPVSEVFFIGSGVGANVMLLSKNSFEAPFFSEKQTFYNRSYKRVMPALPLEASLHFTKISLTIRYELALLNKYRGDLAKNRHDYYGVLSYEVGFRIR